MVKPDASVDYYAELELPPDCNDDDIKKQYRKLGENRRSYSLVSNSDCTFPQLCNFTPTGTLDEKPKPARGSKLLVPLMRSCSIPSPVESTTLIAGGAK